MKQQQQQVETRVGAAAAAAPASGSRQPWNGPAGATAEDIAAQDEYDMQEWGEGLFAMSLPG